MSINAQKTNKKFHVIVAAAGNGQRLASDIPKQYIPLHGKTILRHTLDNILGWRNLGSLRVIIDPDHEGWYQNAVTGLDLPQPLHGGKERNISINNALNSISDIKDDDIILIHDAARPFVRGEDVERLLKAFEHHRAATLAVPVSDTLRQSRGADAAEIIDRQGLWALQTPQAFYYGDLKKAHIQAENAAGYTDDTSLISAIGIPVHLVHGSRTNIKITTQEDLIMAKALLSSSTETRTGTGFDVHAFDAGDIGRPLVLCGIEIRHDRSLAGHSDADVALHALTDALLGAIGEGDIGLHFPPSDATFKNMDSAIFLQKAMDMLKDKGGALINADLTIICEEPKIGPHRDAMRVRIAEICGVDSARINVKATTTERLGFTGRGEGIAAQAVVTVRIAV